MSQRQEIFMLSQYLSYRLMEVLVKHLVTGSVIAVTVVLMANRLTPQFFF
jgi:hypothetical protein